MNSTQKQTSPWIRLGPRPRSTNCLPTGVWIAERDGVSVGHAVLTVRYTMEHGALSGYIDDLFVRPECRRVGVARALMRELTRECQHRNCKSIYVEVGEDNAPALGLYREFGLNQFQDGRLGFDVASLPADVLLRAGFRTDDLTDLCP